MKARHVLAIVVTAAATAWALLSCNLMGTTIDQRISTFQSDMNTSDRSSAYQDFDPSMADYGSLKNGTYFSTIFPVPGTSYTFSVISESNTSAVIVQVNTGSTISGYIPPNCYLNLNMTELSGNNWVIHSLSVGGTPTGTWSVVYQ